MADQYSIDKLRNGELWLAINGKRQVRLFRMKEALSKIGITAPTYYRWVNSGQVEDVKFRDRANWRLFTNEDIERIRAEASKVNVVVLAPPDKPADEPPT